MRSLIQIYALAVCFAALMCFVVALGVGLYDVVQITAPDFTLQYYQPYQSNDAFLQYYPENTELPGDKITELRERGLREALDGERRAAWQSAVFILIIVAIDVAVFAVHWRIARKERLRAEQAASAST